MACRKLDREGTYCTLHKSRFNTRVVDSLTTARGATDKENGGAWAARLIDRRPYNETGGVSSCTVPSIDDVACPSSTSAMPPRLLSGSSFLYSPCWGINCNACFQSKGGNEKWRKRLGYLLLLRMQLTGPSLSEKTNLDMDNADQTANNRCIAVKMISRVLLSTERVSTSQDLNDGHNCESRAVSQLSGAFTFFLGLTVL